MPCRSPPDRLLNIVGSANFDATTVTTASPADLTTNTGSRLIRVVLQPRRPFAVRDLSLRCKLATDLDDAVARHADETADAIRTDFSRSEIGVLTRHWARITA
jgi:hypothetical protein